MKTLTIVWLASLAVLSSPARVLAGEPATTPVAPAATPSWSLGGGLTFSSLGYVSYESSSFLLSSNVVPVPGATGTLERRLSDRSWLFLNLRGGVQRKRAEVADGSYGISRDDRRQVTASVGWRRALTRRGGPVEVSTVLGVHGGILDAEQTQVVPSTTATSTDSTLWFAGANLGIAIQRELTDGLALRLSTPLLHGTYDHGRTRSPGQPTRTSTGLSFAAEIVPQLELVAFF